MECNPSDLWQVLVPAAAASQTLLAIKVSCAHVCTNAHPDSLVWQEEGGDKFSLYVGTIRYLFFYSTVPSLFLIEVTLNHEVLIQDK